MLKLLSVPLAPSVSSPYALLCGSPYKLICTVVEKVGELMITFMQWGSWVFFLVIFTRRLVQWWPMQPVRMILLLLDCRSSMLWCGYRRKTLMPRPPHPPVWRIPGRTSLHRSLQTLQRKKKTKKVYIYIYFCFFRLLMLLALSPETKREKKYGSWRVEREDLWATNQGCWSGHWSTCWGTNYQNPPQEYTISSWGRVEELPCFFPL